MFLGIWLPRVSENHGQPLTSPRMISTTLFPDLDRPNTEFTLMLMQFGQFLSHDVTQSIDSTFGETLFVFIFILLRFLIYITCYQLSYFVFIFRLSYQ